MIYLLQVCSSTYVFTSSITLQFGTSDPDLIQQSVTVKQTAIRDDHCRIKLTRLIITIAMHLEYFGVSEIVGLVGINVLDN